jgi:hypothetical protein
MASATSWAACLEVDELLHFSSIFLNHLLYHWLSLPGRLRGTDRGSALLALLWNSRPYRRWEFFILSEGMFYDPLYHHQQHHCVATVVQITRSSFSSGLPA